MITCRELTEFLVDYLAGELDEQRAEIVRKHLAVCPDCANYLESYRRSIALSQAAMLESDAPAPADVPTGLLNAIRAARDAK